MVVGIMRVKDEADLIAETVCLAMGQFDYVLVADNLSTDGTESILRDLGTWPNCKVTVDTEVAYYQSAAMSRLAADALALGATWVVPVDADEVWRPTHGEGRIADLLEALPDEVMACEATVYDHVAVGDCEGLSPWRRRDPLPLPKVACRAVEGMTIWQGNHGVRYPDLEAPLTVTGQLEVRHFPYRTPEQFIRKVRNGAAAYAATDLPESTGEHWRMYGRMADDDLREHFHRWFYSEDPENDPNLVYDPCPLNRPSASSPGEAAAPTVSAP